MEPQHSACSSTRLLTQLPSVHRTEGNDWSQANFRGSVLCPSRDHLARCPSTEGTDEEFKKRWFAGKVTENSGCHCLVPRVLQATHSHNHTHTHVYTQSHPSTNPPTHTHTDTHSHTHTHTLTHVHTHPHPTHTLTNTPCPTHSHTHLTHPHTFIHTLTPHTHNSHIH